MPNELSKDLEQKILRVARELTGLGVNVLGFLEQARDGQNLLGDGRGERPSIFAERAAKALRNEELEYSDPLFAPGLLWTVTDWRRLLSEGYESKELQAELQDALVTVADALSRRRTGTHGKPTPRGILVRRREDALLVKVLAKMAELASEELTKAKARREETTPYYVDKLRRIDFWNRLNASFTFDPEKPTSRESRLWYTKHRLDRDLFDPAAYLAERSMERQGLLPPATPADAERRRERPSLGDVVAAMATALLGGEVDPEIFGGSGEADKRATAQSLARRALHKVSPGNLEIPKR